MTIRETIALEMRRVADEQKKSLARLTDDLVLLDCGLDSLCFAILVARLEDEIGYDPFGQADDVDYPVTFKEFVDLYERAPA